MLKLFLSSLILIQLSLASIRRLLHPHPDTTPNANPPFPLQGPPNPIVLPAAPINPVTTLPPQLPNAATPAVTTTAAPVIPVAPVTTAGNPPPPPPELTLFPLPPITPPQPQVPITTASPPPPPQTTGAAAPAPGTTANAAAACTAACPFMLSPICGSDGQTYINDCLAGCLSVIKAYNGPCSSTATPPAGNNQPPPPPAPLPPAGTTTAAPITVVTTQPAIPAVPAPPVTPGTTVAAQPPVPPVVPAPPQPSATIFTPPQPPASPVSPITPISPGVPVFTPTPPPTTTTTLPPLPGHIFGAYGQNCPTPTGTEQCAATTEFVTDMTANTQGLVSCMAAADCCLCSYISCGSPASLTCESMTFQGENAAFGVKDITVYSDPGLFAGISCMGRKSCAETNIMAEGIVDMSCMGRHGCERSEIVITNPGPEFSLTCGVTRSCAESKITVNFTHPPSGNVCDPQATKLDVLLGGVECIGVEACKGMEFTVINNGCDNIILDGLECRQGSCEGAQFNFYGTGPIGVSSCQLPSAGPQPMGVDRCFANLRQINCPDPSSCANQRRTITDPMNGFMLMCENELACSNANYVIDISATRRIIPTETIQIMCNSPFSCQGMNVIINNENQVPVFVDVICSGEGACNYAKFTTGPNVMLAEVTCGNVDLCEGCTHDGLTCGGFPAPSNTFTPITPPWYTPPIFPGTPQQPTFPAPGPPGPIFNFPAPAPPQFPVFPSPYAPAPAVPAPAPQQPQFPVYPSPYAPAPAVPAPAPQTPQFPVYPSPYVPAPPQQPVFPAPAPQPAFPAPAPLPPFQPWAPIVPSPPQQPRFPVPAPQPAFPAPAPRPMFPAPAPPQQPLFPAPAPLPAAQPPVAPAPPVYQPWWMQYPQFNYPQFNYPQQPGSVNPAQPQGGPSFVFNQQSPAPPQQPVFPGNPAPSPPVQNMWVPQPSPQQPQGPIWSANPAGPI